MSLQHEMSEMKKKSAEKITPEIMKVMAAETEKLIKSGLADRALKKGDRAAGFTLPNAIGATVNFETLLEKGNLVVSFYRGGWCPYCNMELSELHNILPDIKSLGGQLVAISPQTPDHSLSDAQKFALEFEVLSDISADTARAFGLVFTLAEKLRPIYADFGIDLPEYNGNNSFELPIPATYVIGTDGIIEHAFVDADYTRRMEPADIITVLTRLSENG